MDLSPLAAAGTRIHATPRQFNVPLLMLDRVAGAKVLADAALGKRQKLVLDAHEEENATAFEIVATLPGRNYGTLDDQSLLLATHVDGPSIVEDDGGLGILSVLHYYATIPQAERPKSIVVYFESRHFVPGTEPSYPLDITKELPDRFKSVVGGLALEHFGGLQFAEDGDTYAATGRAATTYIWGWPNSLAIDAATNAIKHQSVPRAINDVPARPGVNGKPHSRLARRRLLPLSGPILAAGRDGNIFRRLAERWLPGLYPSAKSRVSADVFLKQASAAVELLGVLMTKDCERVGTCLGIFADGYCNAR
jgi:hypothetical protein